MKFKDLTFYPPPPPPKKKKKKKKKCFSGPPRVEVSSLHEKKTVCMRTLKEEFSLCTKNEGFFSKILYVFSI